MTAFRGDFNWQNQAACRGPQAAAFFPPPETEPRKVRARREDRAKAICSQCNVRESCLDYALSIRERHGVWGGLGEVERRKIIKAADLTKRPIKVVAAEHEIRVALKLANRMAKQAARRPRRAASSEAK